MKLKTIVQGFGVATVVLILRIVPQLSSYHLLVYQSYLPMHSIVFGLLIDIAVVTMLFALLFHYLDKSDTGLRTAIWSVVAAMVGSNLVGVMVAVRRASIPYLNSEAVSLSILLVGLALYRFNPATYRRITRIFIVLLTVGGCSLLWVVPDLVYQGVRGQRADAPLPTISPATTAQRTGPAASGNRIVWLLFDELSYDQTFEHRFPGVDLPAFDAFRRKSVVFENLQPAGYYTVRVIPSFFLGTPVDNLRSNLDGQASIKLMGAREWKPFDAHATLFADAQRLGWTTGVVGWYNPYCRMLAGTLNYCYWRSGDGQTDGALPEYSSWKNAWEPVFATVRSMMHKPSFARQRHAEDWAAVMPQAERLVRDPDIGFVFIHLPVPHPPNIYDRKLGRPSLTGSYIDNLVLADKSLAHLMEIIGTTPMAATTTVIVCSDHSWRLPLWKSVGAWTKEDEAASHGRFDPRPVLMIHSPGQQAERDITTPFESLGLHEVIERLLHGEPALP
jgi:hypothetical protein